MSTKLKRLELAHDYILNVPERLVDLNEIGFELTGHGLTQKCGVVGCLGGWLGTMPEVREFAGIAPDKELRAGFDFVAEWLGVHNNSERDDWLFRPRLNRSIPEKEEALQRLQVLIERERQRQAVEELLTAKEEVLV